MTAAGDARNSFAEVEGRVFDIEEGLLALKLTDRARPPSMPKPARPPRSGTWALTTVLAIFGSAAVIGPFLLILTS